MLAPSSVFLQPSSDIIKSWILNKKKRGTFLKSQRLSEWKLN